MATDKLTTPYGIENGTYTLADTPRQVHLGKMSMFTGDQAIPFVEKTADGIHAYDDAITIACIVFFSFIGILIIVAAFATLQTKGILPANRIICYRVATVIGCIIMAPLLVLLPLHLAVSMVLHFFIMPSSTGQRPSWAQQRDWVVQLYLLLFLNWEHFCRVRIASITSAGAPITEPEQEVVGDQQRVTAWQRMCAWMQKKSKGPVDVEQGRPPPPYAASTPVHSRNSYELVRISAYRP